MTDEEENELAELPFTARWEYNPYDAPSVVNQIVLSEGVSTKYGSDGLIYLRLGHTAPPPGGPTPDEDGMTYLTVNNLGYFTFSLERAQELSDLLKLVIENNTAVKRRGVGRVMFDDDVI